MVALPSRDTNAGVEARVLLAECRGPSSSSYKLATATQCMATKLTNSLLKRGNLRL